VIHLKQPAGDTSVADVEALLPPTTLEQDVQCAEASFARQDVAVVEDTAVAMADPILAQAAAIARLPGLNEGMFSRLMEWQKEERAAQAKERWTEAMNKAQAEIIPVARTVQNTQTKSLYAKLEAVDAAIRPIYLAHGFSVSYNTVPPLMPGNIRVECAVSLGRHTELYYREAAPDTTGPQGKAVKTMLHGGASSETFMKRYALCGAFNVVFRNLDDDGVKGGKEYVTDEELAVLERLVEETETSLPEFFNLMTSEEIHELNEVSRLDFNRFANALVRKKNQQMAKRSAAS
jgi:hypothetical protein